MNRPSTFSFIASRAQTRPIRQKGFTLLEILIAVSVLAMMSGAMFTILNNITNQNEVSKDNISELEKLQRAFFIMDRDFQQIAQRYTRVDGDPPSQSVFAAGRYQMDSEADAVAFVRDGWRNPGMILPRSELQSVAYRVREGKLEKLFHIYTDPITGTEPKSQILLDDIEDFVLQFYAEGSWKEQWEQGTLPQAVSVTVTTKNLGAIRRVFLMPANI